MLNKQLLRPYCWNRCDLMFHSVLPPLACRPGRNTKTQLVGTCLGSTRNDPARSGKVHAVIAYTSAVADFTSLQLGAARFEKLTAGYSTLYRAQTFESHREAC